MRGERQAFTHSRVMAWVAMDRSIGDVERLRPRRAGRSVARARAAIHADVWHTASTASAACWCSATARETLDASLLLVPIVGFLPADDPRVRATVKAIERELTSTAW